MGNVLLQHIEDVQLGEDLFAEDLHLLGAGVERLVHAVPESHQPDFLGDGTREMGYKMLLEGKRDYREARGGRNVGGEGTAQLSAPGSKDFVSTNPSIRERT